jgi:hypothetical protein
VVTKTLSLAMIGISLTLRPLIGGWTGLQSNALNF